MLNIVILKRFQRFKSYTNLCKQKKQIDCIRDIYREIIYSDSISILLREYYSSLFFCKLINIADKDYL